MSASPQINEEYVAGKARLWASLASQSLHAIFNSASELFDRADLTLEEDSKRVLRSLNISCQLTSESLLVLVRESRFWDSEILMRSINEGSVKLFYMAVSDKSLRIPRVYEYDKVLPEIDILRWHDRAARFLGAMQNPQQESLRPIRELIQSEERLGQIRGRYSKQLRKELANKWSFSELARLLALEDPKRYGALAPLSHGYNISSQLLHQSSDGVGVIRDRIGRSERRRHAVELGHAARLVSDTLSMAKVRAIAIRRLFGQDVKPVVDLDAADKALDADIDEAQRYFQTVEYEGDPEKGQEQK